VVRKRKLVVSTLYVTSVEAIVEELSRLAMGGMVMEVADFNRLSVFRVPNMVVE